MIFTGPPDKCLGLYDYTLIRLSDFNFQSAIVLLNTGYKSEEYLREILKLGTLGKFIHLLKSQDDELAFLALQFCDMMLRTFPESREIFEKADGVVHLEALQYGRNDQICQCVNDLMGPYFENELDVQ